LLQEAHDDSPEIDWGNWARELGLPSDLGQKTVRYSSFNQVIAAAIEGAGLALGRVPLITPELKSGRLVRLRPNLSRPASWCLVLCGNPLRRHRMLPALIKFLQSEAAE
jgi:LysR family transcriptional regulator, glycine cleavage system transcriptional activator